MQELAERFGRRQAARLDVSVPFHSSMLRQAGERFATQLARAPLQEPAFPIVCNVDAEPVTTSAAVRDALVRQFAGSVLWQPSIEHLLGDGHRRFVEFGPKPVLKRMVEQIAAACNEQVTAVAVCEPQDLGAALAGA
jgi:[acyl-carrier-protein] S-malonyltransferase